MDDVRPAGFWIRVVAQLVDTLILVVFGVGAAFLRESWQYVAVTLAMVAYKPLLESWLGATAGKIALGLKVINAEGGRLSMASAWVRSGVFILPVIPNAMLQVKMIEANVAPFDAEGQRAIQESNQVLLMASLLLSAVAIMSCIVVAFNHRKRGLHDMMAESYVVHQDKGGDL